MSNVKFFKLVNGEEFIALVTHDDDKVVSIVEPMVIVNGPDGMSFMPWVMMSAERSMEIKSRDVLFGKGLNVDADAERQYMSAKDQFNAIRVKRETGMDIPTSPNLILT